MSQSTAPNPPPAKVRLPNSVHLTQKSMVAAVAFYRDRLGFALFQWQLNDKSAARANLTVDRDRAAHQANKLPANG